ncbi:MAG: hypothetical protein FWE24_03035 [Defluviitaleaceae bacterium]|nr:hypothetical protein [Defluviitaleaceae bacterium]
MPCEKCGYILEGDGSYCPECVKRSRRTSPKGYFIIFGFCIGVMFFSFLMPAPVSRIPIDVPIDGVDIDIPLRMPLFFMSPFLFGVAPYIAALATVISAKINNPQNTVIAVLFWTFIAVTVLMVVLVVIAIIACFAACNACAGELQSCR